VRGVILCHMDTRTRLDVSTIGRRVLARRTELRLDQEALADRAGLSRPYVSRLERGLVPNPGLTHLEQIAGALEWSLSELIRPEMPGAKISPALYRELQTILGPNRGAALTEAVEQLSRRTEQEQDDALRVMRMLLRDAPTDDEARP
jgi:transcriptional regulator with XRE-family HTH domain